MTNTSDLTFLDRMEWKERDILTMIVKLFSLWSAVAMEACFLKTTRDSGICKTKDTLNGGCQLVFISINETEKMKVPYELKEVHSGW
jgi:hypothetical protein